MRKEDDMPLYPKVGRLIASLESHNSADNVRAGDKQFFDPGEVFQYIGNRSDPSKISERLRRSFPKRDTGMAATA